MEQTNLSPNPSPGLGQCGSDRELFERVWRRVMPEDRADCPITLLSDEEAEVEAERAGTTDALYPACPLPRQPDLPQPLTTETVVLTSEQDVPLLGAASAVYGPLLQAMIAAEVLSFRQYRALSRRMSGASGRVVASMASDERRHARRLSAAYFLISGVRYMPPDSALTSRPEAATAGALRRYFAEEQRAEAGYRSAAMECSDPMLASLFEELAQDEAAHRDLILSLLEQM